MFGIHLCFRMALSVLFAGVWMGCFSPERDNIADPYNTPIFRVFDARYEPTKGSVRVQWEYLSRGTPALFEVHRKIEDEISVIGVVEGSGLSEGQTHITFQDSALIAGASALYWVRVTGAGGRLAQSAVNAVRIPGVSLLEPRSDPVNGHLQVKWTGGSEGVAGYEIFRRVDDGAEERVFHTEDVTETTFVDKDVIGNTTYTYTVHSLMSGGVRLKSTPLSGAVYGQIMQPAKVDGATGMNSTFRLFTNVTLNYNDAIQVLSVASNLFQRKTYRIYWSTSSVRVSDTRSTNTMHVDGFVPESVSVAGLTSYQTTVMNIREAWVAGLNAGTGKAELLGWGSSSYVPKEFRVWDTQSGDQHTALTLDLRYKRLFMSVGKLCGC